MARDQSPLALAQARALRTLSADASTPAASPETLVSVMAPPAASPGADRGSPSRPPLAGVAEASVPSSFPLRPLGTLVVRAQSCFRADSADSQPHDSVSGSGASGDGACSAADAPDAPSAAPGAPRFYSVRWEDIEDIVTTGTDRTVRQVQESAQSHFVALARLVVDLNRRPPLRTDYELDQHLEASGSLSDVVDALAPIPRSPAPWEYELTELRDDVASLEARLAASEASLRREVDLRLKAERLCNQASHERNATLENLRRLRLDHANAARQLVATNIALEQSSQAAAVLEQRCRRLDKSLADTHKVIRQDPEQFKAGIASYAAQLRQLREYLEHSDHQSSFSGGTSSTSASALPAAFTTFLEVLGALQLAIPPPPSASGSSEASASFLGESGGAKATPGSSTSLTVNSDTSDDSGPVIPSSLHKGKGKRPAKSSAKLRSAPSPPKEKQRLGRPSVDLKARKAAKQAASAEVSSSGPSQSVPSSLPAASVSTSSVPVSRIAPSGITPGTEASVPVEIGDDGGSGADGTASDAFVASGGVFSSPVVFLPRRDGRPTRAASTTAGLRSMTAADNEAAPDALILNARIPQPIASDRVTECSVAGIHAFDDWEDPMHPWQRLRARLPESPCTFGADDFMSDKPISVRASGLAIGVKLRRQFTGRAVGRTEHSDLGLALWEHAHWISIAAVEQWLQQLCDWIGSDTPAYLETEAAWRAYNKARNLRADRLRLASTAEI
ncbi:unnamed protein product [Phytophthora fragariaefolia]|uniref:Unnamed protein product n=1 Tax=Phytophthora fragariaefolia TaxID=1490495 RepID=A0A9W6TVN7_9STRA|nr:unnamed protein product [Phytophthora fragariaefolia]